MAFIRWVLLTVVILIVLRLVRFALAPAPRPSGRRAVRPAPGRPERLVQDPVCGLRLPESRAVREGDAYFCSEECLRASRAR
jgi:hypothetical protein